MMILGKSRCVAALVAASVGLAVVPAFAQNVKVAQISPTGLPVPTPPPNKPAPAQPATKPAPAAAAPAAQPAQGAAAQKPAPAKPADPKALMASGEKKYKAGDHAGALADFEAANAAKASPEAERYIGLSQDKLGHLPEAVTAYERFLANVPAKMKAEGEEAKARAFAIKQMPGKVHVESTPAGAHITVLDAAGAPAGATATAPGSAPSAAPGAAGGASGSGAAGTETGRVTPADLELAPGKHTIRLSAEGFESTDKEVDVTFASKQDVKVDLVKKEAPPPPPVVAEAPAPEPVPPPPPPPEPRSKVPAYITGGVAIVAAGVGTAFGIKALGQSSDFDKGPTTQLADDGENSALIADMMFGIAITFGVTSAVLFLSSDAPQTAKADPPKGVVQASAAPKPAPKPAPKVTLTPVPYVTSTGGGAGALLRF